MQRIKLEILTEVNRLPDSRMWVIELVEDEIGNFSVRRYYGNESAAKFVKKTDLVTEHFEEGLKFFEDKIRNKLNKGEYRKFRNGEGSNSPALLAIFRPSTQKIKAAVKPEVTPEHRRLTL